MWERKKVVLLHPQNDASVAQLVEHLTLNQGVLLHPQNDASVAQLVEHLTLNQGVQGSTPCGSTEKPLIFSGFRCFYPPAGSTILV